MKKIVLLIMIILMSFSVCASCPASMVSYWTFDDSFDDDFSTFDSNNWIKGGSGGSEGSVVLNNEKLRVDYTGDVDNVQYYAKATDKWLIGDFDVQIDFESISLPTPSSGEDGGFLVIHDDYGLFSYVAYRKRSTGINDYAFRTFPTVIRSDSSGKFRITREGSDITGYYWDGNNWVEIATHVGLSSNPIWVELWITHTGTLSQSVTFDFDNFIINKGAAIRDKKGTNEGEIILGNEMVTNGDIETDYPYINTAYWLGRGSVSRVTDKKYSGSYSEKYTANSDVGAHYLGLNQKSDGQMNGFEAGKTYRATGYVYLPNNGFDSVGFRLESGVSTMLSDIVTTNDVWQKIDWTFTLPSDATKVSFFLWNPNPNSCNGCEVYMDDLTVKEIGATSTAGKIGDALSFDGVDDSVYTGYKPNWGSSQSFSLSSWFKTNSTQDNQNIMFVISEQGANDPIIGLVVDGVGSTCTQNRLCFTLRDSNGVILTDIVSNTNVNDGVWHHAVAVRDVTADKFKLYLDGILHSEVEDTTTGGFDLTGYGFPIGSRNLRGTLDQSFNGQIDEVAIYNTALTAQEVADLYAGSSNDLGYCSGAVQVTEPVWSGSLDLTTVDGTAIDDTTNEITLQVRDGSNPLVEFTRSGSLNMSAFTIDSDTSRTVVDFSEVTGTTGTHSLFIPDNGGGVFICPDATSLGDVAVGCSNSVTIASCPGTSGVYSCTDEGSYFKITGLTGSGVGTTCNDCADCDTGLYCDLRDGTPTCKNSTLVAAVDCVDCVDNDADTLIDLDDPGCAGSSSGTSEVDGGGATIPEFNFVGYLLILVIAGIGLYFISRK